MKGFLQAAVDEVTGRMVGSRIRSDYGGHPFEATVASVALYRGGQDGARILLEDASWNGLNSSRVLILAGQLTLTLLPRLALRMVAVEVQAEVPLAELVRRLDPRQPGLRLSVTRTGEIVALTPLGHRLTVEPALRHDELKLRLKKVGWAGVGLPLPEHGLLTRRWSLPPLPAGASVVTAQRRGAAMEIAVGLPTLSWSPSAKGSPGSGSP